jgi:biotin synthase
MTCRAEILSMLTSDSPERVADMMQVADQTRAARVGDEVHLRGLVEISNHCRRDCTYCGLRASNRNVKRFRMSDDEIMSCVYRAAGLGYGSVVLQAGEEPALGSRRVAELILRIIGETGLAVTLSLGERNLAELAAWREAGASRYLLRFETSDQDLLRKVHPPLAGGAVSQHPRLELLRALRRLGFETGGGVMVGLPGQSYSTLANDLLTFASLELDMIGVGPWVPNPATPLGRAGLPDTPDQTPNSTEMTLRTIALTRLVRPGANIPATTALSTVGGTECLARALSCGANVIMPDLTPPKYREHYSIYPGKSGFFQESACQDEELQRVISSLGRTAGRGPGHSPSFIERKRDIPAVCAEGAI